MIKEKMKQLVGKSIKAYNNEYSKPKIDELKFKEQYQGRIIDCMVGEVDDNYIETPETNEPIVKLEHSKEGVVKIPSIKGKTILVDSEGNATDTPGKGCRLISVGESENNRLLISSKNKNIVNRKIIDMKHAQGTYVTSDNGGHANPSSIEYLPKGKYIFSIDSYNVSNFVDSSIIIWKEDLSTQTCRRSRINQPFEILDGEVGFTWYGAVNKSAGETISSLLGRNIQVELGETRTSYVEPQSHKTEILLNEPLRSLPNGVCDEIMGNQLIRRIGKVILDGSENWWGNWRNTEDTYATICRTYYNNKLGGQAISNYLPHKTYSDVYWGGIGIGVYTDKSYSFALGFPKIEEYSTPNLILSDYPITVLYELAEPIIEELPNGITLQGFDDTTMYIENSITPTVQYGYNALIPYKEELSQQKEEVEMNTLDIEQNIIPYLMDMEFNLMLMEDE